MNRVRLLMALACAASFSSHAAESDAPSLPTGASLFAAHCSVCHGAAGLGVPSLAPPLTSYPAQYAKIPEGRRQLAMTVLRGLFGDITVDTIHYNFKMPEFAQLDDATLASVLNFVIFDIAKAPAATPPLTSQEIAHERQHTTDGQAVRRHRLAVLDELGLPK